MKPAKRLGAIVLVAALLLPSARALACDSSLVGHHEMEHVAHSNAATVDVEHAQSGCHGMMSCAVASVAPVVFDQPVLPSGVEAEASLSAGRTFAHTVSLPPTPPPRS